MNMKTAVEQTLMKKPEQQRLHHMRELYQMLDEKKTMTYLETWKSMVEHIIPEMTANLETWRPLSDVLKLTEMTAK